MTKMFYIATLEAVHTNHGLFKEAHYFHLNETEVMLVAKFLHEGQELIWRKAHPSIERLPHLLSRKALHPHHVKKLAHLGVQDGHSTFDMAEAISQHYPLHGPESF